MTEPEQNNAAEIAARRRKRSVALAWALGVVVVIFYALTVVKMGPGLFNRPL